MVKQAVPAIAVHTCEALIAAEICTAENGCVLAQVALVMGIDPDGAWYAHYHDPDDPMRNAQLSGNDRRTADALTAMLTTIASLATPQP